MKLPILHLLTLGIIGSVISAFHCVYPIPSEGVFYIENQTDDSIRCIYYYRHSISDTVFIADNERVVLSFSSNSWNDTIVPDATSPCFWFDSILFMHRNDTLLFLDTIKNEQWENIEILSLGKYSRRYLWLYKLYNQ